MLPGLYLLSLIALAVGTGGVWMALSEAVPVRWQYLHYRWRKPVVWTALGLGLVWAGLGTGWNFPARTIPPLVLLGLAVVLAYRLHQEVAFPAVDFPATSDDPASLPIPDDAPVAIVEHSDVTRAYPLDYVIHHHVVNDRFGDRIVAVTYCAMCRTIIPFDVTDIGPLFVGSFHDANMIVADRATGTFFQQATAESLVGKLHPHTLTPLPYQILPWSQVLVLDPLPQVTAITEKDMRAFQLPVPGLWRRIMAGDSTPGLSAGRRDRTHPARTRVIGVTDPAIEPVAYLKADLSRHGVFHDRERGVVFVVTGETVNAFGDTAGDERLEPELSDSTIVDRRTGTTWDLRGKHLAGPVAADLDPVPISDEYWFSWRFFHPEVPVDRV